MKEILIFFACLLGTIEAISQESAVQKLLNDPAMLHASASIKIVNAEDGANIFEYDPRKCLMPASVHKLITSAAALELLGPEFCFITRLGYRGDLNIKTGLLTGDIIISGGGDPALGSSYFRDHYGNFIKRWINSIRNLGIKKIEGRVISDDSRYDYQPVPSKWLWEDLGNYYGAGAYGLSAFDNMYEIHFRTAGEESVPVITGFVPEICSNQYPNYLTAWGKSDKGYIFAAPYNQYGWMAGTIPVNSEDFILKASLTDPPMFVAQMLDFMLDSAGIEVSMEPVTARLEPAVSFENLVIIDEISSPQLKDIIEVLNHESVNLFAEHLMKEMGYKYYNKGATTSGIETVFRFLEESGAGSSGFFFEDGSGLSPMNAVSSEGLTGLLLYMRNGSNNFDSFYASLPDAGSEGTVKNGFRSEVFKSNLRAKSGSMTRVRSYAGYFKTLSGKELVFSIIINNYSGSSGVIVNHIEEILKETILYK